jgi:hypothetical protein
MPKIVAIALAVVLATLQVVLTLAFLGRTGEFHSASYAAGAVLGRLTALPLVSVGIASIWRSNRNPTRLLVIADVALALGVVLSLANLGRTLADGRPHGGRALDRWAAEFRTGVLQSCAEQCPAQTSARLGFPATRCDSFCVCFADGMTAIERTTGSSPEAAKPVLLKCAGLAH